MNRYACKNFEDLKEGEPVLAFGRHVARWNFEECGEPAYAFVPTEDDDADTHRSQLAEKDAEIKRLTAENEWHTDSPSNYDFPTDQYCDRSEEINEFWAEWKFIGDSGITFTDVVIFSYSKDEWRFRDNPNKIEVIQWRQLPKLPEVNP